MSMDDLERVLGDQWERVRCEQYYPQLPRPRFSEGVSNGELQWKNLHIVINPKFVTRLEEKVAPEILLHGVLSHEVMHFIKYPGSFGHLLRLTQIALKQLDYAGAIIAREHFLNVQVNSDLVLKQKNDSVPKMLSSISPQTPLDRIVWRTYERLWGVNLGSKAGRQERKVARKLAELPYLDKRCEEATFEAFMYLIRNYVKDDRPPVQNCMGLFSGKQMVEGIMSVAREIDDPQEFDAVMKHVVKELKEQARQKKSKKGLFAQLKSLVVGSDEAALEELQVGAGIESGELTVASSLYAARAEKYVITIKKAELFKTGGVFPLTHERYDVGDQYERIDVFSSKGILPGVTQKWVYADGHGFDCSTKVPNVFLIIDASGSMPDPKKELSIPVLCATVIVNTYVKQGADVSVYVFSGEDIDSGKPDAIVYGPSRNKSELHEKVKSYFGGGTVFSTDVLEGVINEVKEMTDIVVVSDMCINNLESFISSIHGLPKIHRVHLLYTQGYSEKILRGAFSKAKNVVIRRVEEEKDIEKLVMGDMRCLNYEQRE